MLNHKIVRLSSTERLGNIVQPLVRERGVHRVHHRHLLVANEIRVVRHALRHNVVTLEKVDVVIVNAYVKYIVCNSHKTSGQFKFVLFLGKINH